MSTTEAPIDAPDYMEGFPPMSGFVSNSNYELGWLSGLHKTAAKSIDQIYGSYDEFRLNPDDLADLENLNFDTFVDSPGAIIYASAWAVVALVFTIIGICWCCSNKCICCCKSGFKGRKHHDDNERGVRPHFSERNDNRYKNSNTSAGAIVLTVLMVIWLAGLLLIILYTFAGNNETNKAIDNIEVDLNNGFNDADNFLNITNAQLVHLLEEGFLRFSAAVDDTIKSCIDPYPVSPEDACKTLEDKVKAPLLETDTELKKSVSQLNKGLTEVQTELKDAKKMIDDDYQEYITDSNNGLYWFFMLFNIIYCIIFALVVIGMILAVAARSNGLKTSGYLTIRGAIVLMFLSVFFIVTQMILMFSVGGITTQIFCPALRALEMENSDSGVTSDNQEIYQGITDSPTEYELPKYGEIMQACKRDESAYKAFNLETAYNVKNLKDVVKGFEELITEIPTLPPGFTLPTTNTPTGSTPPPRQLDPKETVEEIVDQVDHYIEFIIKAVEEDVGRCQPAYNAINSLISVFCEKIPAPVTAFWYILQFLPPLFLLIILTALFFERIHF